MTPTRIGLVLACMALPLAAAEQGARERLLTENQCRDCDLSGADLTGANLRAAGLSEATFCRTTMADGELRSDGC